jgi:ribonucleoside-diphosphate reductase alpha chain
MAASAAASSGEPHPNDPQGWLPTDAARNIFADKWAIRDDDGVPVETFAEACGRVAHTAASAMPDSFFEMEPDEEAQGTDQALKRYPDLKRVVRRIGGSRQELRGAFREMLLAREFFPNSPTWTGAGRPLGQLAACFVLPVDDEMGRGPDGIFSTLRNAVLIQQSGGGNGFDFSKLRPKGELVSKSKGKASGVISFLGVYDTAFGTIAQGGVRRGANMAVLRCDHPEIFEFIACKSVEGTISNFNISVGVTDDFMECVEEDGDWDLVHGEGAARKVFRTVKARELMDRITEGAWRNGEPGVVFLDRINLDNPVPGVYTLAATNPCGEQALGPYENCCLGSVNLAAFVRPNRAGADGDSVAASLEDTIDTEAYMDACVLGGLFLDCIVTANKYVDAVPQLREAAMARRRVGLGPMGLADVLMAARAPYDSDEGRSLVGEMMHGMMRGSILASAYLSHTCGAFPDWGKSIYPDFFSEDDEGRTLRSPDEIDAPPAIKQIATAGLMDLVSGWGLRNAVMRTSAPTGTIATVAGCEGYGCEPVFALSYTRFVVGGDPIQYESQLLKDHFAALGKSPEWSARVMADIRRVGGDLGLVGLENNTAEIFKTAMDIAPVDHVAMQAVVQQYVDNSISKTINMPNEATVADVRKVYREAFNLGCKGITVYRTGSRDKVVLSTETPSADAADESEEGEEEVHNFRVARPDVIRGVTLRGPSPSGQVLVTINTVSGGPLEVIVTTSKAGSEICAIGEATGRLITSMLRMTGGDSKAPSAAARTQRLREVVKQLSGIRGARSIGHGPKRVSSFPDAVAAILRRYIALQDEEEEEEENDGKDGEEADEPYPSPPQSPTHCNGGDICPECGNGTLMHSEGCMKCLACSYTVCG